MKFSQAITAMQADFPFPDYFDVGLGVYENVARQVQAVLPQGGKVLDIGCGPADKTAVLAALGYECLGYDDFGDPWHRTGDNYEKIQNYFKQHKIKFVEHTDENPLPFKDETFDLIMLNDVIEHLHDSPRLVLEGAAKKLKTDGYMLITVPNAVNLRKRLAVLFGKTNYPNYQQFYWYEGPWRGHVREYVQSDLEQLAGFLNMEKVTLTSCHHMLGVLPKPAQLPYKLLTNIWPGVRDSWLLMLQKPANWQPAASPNQSAEIIR